MRQHVNPLSHHFQEIVPIPPLNNIYKNHNNPLHLDIGCASGDFLFRLANSNKDWNYLGIEIRERLVSRAQAKLKDNLHNNLFFAFGNAENLITDCIDKFPRDILESVSFNFPDPWFKKKHHKRRVLQPQLITKISHIMPRGAYILIKSDVEDLFQYMDTIILNSNVFKKFNYSIQDQEKCYNPNNLKTNRESYVLSKEMIIYEQLYKKY